MRNSNHITPLSSLKIRSADTADQITTTETTHQSKQLHILWTATESSVLDAHFCYTFDLHSNHKTDNILLHGEQ